MMRYVIATAAYNEEKYIEPLIKSVVAQTQRPIRWVIVSDGSTDRTDQIVNEYAARYRFIQLHRITEDHPRNFTAQVHAINAGFAQLWNLDFEFIGNLDADITLEPGYFAELLERFDQDPRLGLSGGYIYERNSGKFECRRTNSPSSVAHAVQLFRRECLEEIGGGYTPLPYGGPDWHAEISARMHQWSVKAWTDLRVYHHRPTGTAEGSWNAFRRVGLMHYSFGSHPLFELFKMARRVRNRPFLLGASMTFWVFIQAYWRREERCVSPDFAEFLRREQLVRLREFLWLAAKKDRVS